MHEAIYLLLLCKEPLQLYTATRDSFSPQGLRKVVNFVFLMYNTVACLPLPISLSPLSWFVCSDSWKLTKITWLNPRVTDYINHVGTWWCLPYCQCITCTYLPWAGLFVPLVQYSMRVIVLTTFTIGWLVPQYNYLLHPCFSVLFF
jgi:hypothetical protein